MLATASIKLEVAGFPELLRCFLYGQQYPDASTFVSIDACPMFKGKLSVFHCHRLPSEHQVIQVVLATCNKSIFIPLQVGGKDILDMTVFLLIHILNYQECVGYQWLVFFSSSLLHMMVLNICVLLCSGSLPLLLYQMMKQACGWYSLTFTITNAPIWA